MTRALLVALALLSVAVAVRRRHLRPVAVALVALVVLDLVRAGLRPAVESWRAGELLTEGQRWRVRGDVAIFTGTWPGVLAGLVVAGADQAQRRVQVVGAVLGFALYGLGLAFEGRHLAPIWGWATRAPYLLLGALCLYAFLRRERRAWRPEERIGLVLALGAVAGAAADVWADWAVAAQGLSAGIWALVGLLILREVQTETR